MALRRAELLRLQDLAEVDLLALAVGHFNSDDGLTGHRRLDTHGRRPQRHREVVGKVDYLADLDARARLELVHGDDGARLDLDDAAFDAEIGELLFEHTR